MKASELLVVGFRGTLRASDESSSWMGMGGISQPAGTPELPPQLEETVHRWVESGAAALLRRVPPAALTVGGERVPLAGLLEVLGDRLLGLLTQSVDQNLSHSAHQQHREPPELLRLLHLTVADWVQACSTFLVRLSKDQHRIASALTAGKLQPVAAITGCASDVHAGGHAVLRVQFADGADVFYKPRPVTGEWLWHELLENVAQHDPALRLPAAPVLRAHDLSGYGWVGSLRPDEHGKHIALKHAEGKAAGYWARAGAILCLAQHLRVTDLHMGNVLATSAGPALIDLECLATPATAAGRIRPSLGAAREFEEAYASLMATGLLPEAARPTSLVDVSGFFGQAGPVGGVLLPCWKQSDDGGFRLGTSRAMVVEQGNRPGCAISATTALPKLMQGYRHAAEILLSVRRTLLDKPSAWRSVLEQQHAPRVVVRQTFTYAGWISRSLAPAYLQSHALRRSALAATLKSEGAAGPRFPALWRAEVHAMLAAQVPRFIVLPGKTRLAANSGRGLVPGFLINSPAAEVIAAVERLSTDHLRDVLLPALLSAVLPRV